MGHAFMVLSVRKTKYGVVYVLAVCDPRRTRRIWIEGTMHRRLVTDGIVGPDCNGTVPNKKWFKRFLKKEIK